MTDARPMQPDWMRALRAPPASADTVTRVRWMRETIRPYAGDMAAWEMFGALDRHEGECEVLLAGTGLARRLDAPREEGIVAGRAEWRSAVERVEKFATELNRKLWPLGRARMPGQMILAAANEVNDRFGCVLPAELLLETARKIAHAAAKGRRRGGG